MPTHIDGLFDNGFNSLEKYLIKLLPKLEFRQGKSWQFMPLRAEYLEQDLLFVVVVFSDLSAIFVNHFICCVGVIMNTGLVCLQLSVRYFT